MRRLTCYRLTVSAAKRDAVEYVAYEESPTREDALRRHAAILAGFEDAGNYPIVYPIPQGLVLKEFMGLVFKRVA
jgi:hypothetical protein